MTEWKEAALQDIAYVNPTESISNGTKAKKFPMELLEPFTKRVSGYQIEEYKGGVKFKNGDTIIARITPSLENGKTAFIDILEDDEIGFGSTEFIVLREKEGLSDKNFLYYLALSPDFRETAILSMTGSSGRQRVQTDVVKEHLFNIPPLPEQRVIGSVLSSLDDKIDLLHRQNKTLEQMAETLFKQWFVFNASEEWESRPLSSIATFLNGLACQKYPPENESEKLPVLKIKELRNGISKDCDYCTSNVKPEYVIENGDVIFSWSASLMVKIWDGERCVLNQHLFKVTSDEFPKWYYYLWCKHHLNEFINISASHATTMGHIKRKDLDEAMVLLPQDDEMEYYSDIFTPIIDKIIFINKQIANLKELRDTLLPKLMSGEAKVEIDG